MKGHMNPGLTSKPADLPRELNLLDSTCIVIGTTIGVGIFIVPGTIARELPSPMMILAVWVIAGVISFFGALAYAELGAMMPDSGGQYIYLREAYGPLAAFVSGWGSFLVVQSGSIAAGSVDWESVGEGKGVDLGGARIIKKKKTVIHREIGEL